LEVQGVDVRFEQVERAALYGRAAADVGYTAGQFVVSTLNLTTFDGLTRDLQSNEPLLTTSPASLNSGERVRRPG
jgi:hypothetical protein